MDSVAALSRGISENLERDRSTRSAKQHSQSALMNIRTPTANRKPSDANSKTVRVRLNPRRSISAVIPCLAPISTRLKAVMAIMPPIETPATRTAANPRTPLTMPHARSLSDLRLTARFLPFPLQKQASCLLLPGRLRSLPPPSMAAFLRYRSALSTVCESLDSHTRSKPPACSFRAAFVRFHRPPSGGPKFF